MKREEVKRLLTKHKLDFGLVTDRVKRALQLSTDAELATRLGMSSSNFANRKTANSIPYELLIPLCLLESISLDWVFNGKGKPFTNHDSHTDQLEATALVDPLLFATTLVRLDAALRGVASDPLDRPAMQLAKLAHLGADLYNKISRLKSEKARLSAVTEEADNIARVASLLEGDTQAVRDRLLRDAK